MFSLVLLRACRESFVELQAVGKECRILSLFCVFGPDEREQPWKSSPDGWVIETPEGAVHVRVADNRLTVANTTSERLWQLPLRRLP